MNDSDRESMMKARWYIDAGGINAVFRGTADLEGDVKPAYIAAMGSDRGVQRIECSHFADEHGVNFSLMRGVGIGSNVRRALSESGMTLHHSLEAATAALTPFVDERTKKNLRKATWYAQGGEIVPVFPGNADREHDVNAVRQMMRHGFSSMESFESDQMKYIAVHGLENIEFRRGLLEASGITVHASQEEAVLALRGRTPDAGASHGGMSRGGTRTEPAPRTGGWADKK